MTSAGVWPLVRARRRQAGVAFLFVLLLLIFHSAVAGGEPARAPAEITITPESVLSDLNGAIQWSRDVRVTLRAVHGSAGVPVAVGEEQIAQQVLDRSFATARAKSALVSVPPDASSRPGATPQRATERRESLRNSIRQEEATIVQLESRARRAPAAQRAALEGERI